MMRDPVNRARSRVPLNCPGSMSILGPLPDAGPATLRSPAGHQGRRKTSPRDGGCHVHSRRSVSSSRVEQAVLIVFADLTRFMVNSRSTPDAALAELLDGYYRHAEGLVAAAGRARRQVHGRRLPRRVARGARRPRGRGAVRTQAGHRRVVGGEGLGLARRPEGALRPRGRRALRCGRALRRDRQRGQRRRDASGADGVAVRPRRSAASRTASAGGSRSTPRRWCTSRRAILGRRGEARCIHAGVAGVKKAR